MSLREHVIIKIPGGDLQGELFVGADGLPELLVDHNHAWMQGPYCPATLPASWIVTSPTCGTLYSAWDLIWNLVEELAIAQREADTEDRDRAQQREQENRIAQEIENRRDDEQRNQT